MLVAERLSMPTLSDFSFALKILADFDQRAAFAFTTDYLGKKRGSVTPQWTMPDQPPPPDDLLVQSEVARFKALQANLEWCHTFVLLAHTERDIGDDGGVVQAPENAEMGFLTITRLARDLKDPTHREKIQLGLGKLRAVLDGLAANRSRGADG